jgi:putative addiction module component (TIGR02574 family)
MKRDAAALLKEALTLSAKDRVTLAEALLASLEEPPENDSEAAWKAEIERRIAELDSGVVSPIPWHEVRRHLFERARRRALRRLRNGLDLQWSPPTTRDDLHRR